MVELRDREQQRQGLVRLQQAVKRPTHLVDLDEEVPAVALRIDDTDLEVVYVVGEYDIWRNTNPDTFEALLNIGSWVLLGYHDMVSTEMSLQSVVDYLACLPEEGSPRFPIGSGKTQQLGERSKRERELEAEAD